MGSSLSKEHVPNSASITPETSASQENTQAEHIHPTDDTQSQEEPITLYIIDTEGIRYSIPNVKGNMTMSDLIQKLKEIKQKENDVNLFLYNLILVRSNKELRAHQTVKSNQLMENDELLLVERFMMKSDNSNETEDPQVADMNTIADVTRDLTVRNEKQDFVRSQCRHLTDTQWRNILNKLVEISSHLIVGHNPSTTFQQICVMLDLYLKPNPQFVERLVAMGHDADKSKVALILKENNIKKSLEWLTSEGPSVTTEDVEELFSLLVDVDTVDVNENNFTELVAKVTRYLNKREELNSNTDVLLVKKIEDMGFTNENEIKRALRKSFNEVNRACLLLLNESNVDDENNINDIIIDKIIKDPDNDVLVGLSDKSILFCLLDLLNSSDNTTPWYGARVANLMEALLVAFESEKNQAQGCIHYMDQWLLQGAVVVVLSDD